jgi:hypothetical protein
MINLLASKSKEDIMYARRNTKLLRYCVLALFVIAGIIAISLSGLFYMKQSQKQYAAQIARTEAQLKEQNLEETQKKVESISNNLKLTTQVLSREILFSKLLKQIGSVMPANTSLTDLKIGKTEGGIDLTAIASNYDSATQIQVNLSDPANKIFDKADIINIVCNTNNILDPRYPCTVNIRARFIKDASFYFIAPKGTKS